MAGSEGSAGVEIREIKGGGAHLLGPSRGFQGLCQDSPVSEGDESPLEGFSPPTPQQLAFFVLFCF